MPPAITMLSTNYGSSQSTWYPVIGQNPVNSVLTVRGFRVCSTVKGKMASVEVIASPFVSQSITYRENGICVK
jgi:hypothetical protein